jgi:hypothetical protein
MGRDISGDEFISLLGLIAKIFLVIVAARVGLLIAGVYVRIPILDPFLNALLGTMKGCGMRQMSF